MPVALTNLGVGPAADFQLPVSDWWHNSFHSTRTEEETKRELREIIRLIAGVVHEAEEDRKGLAKHRKETRSESSV